MPRTTAPLTDDELDALEKRSEVTIGDAAQARTYLGGHFRPEVAQAFVDAPRAVLALVHEVRRLRGELQQSLRLNVSHVDDPIDVHGRRKPPRVVRSVGGKRKSDKG